MELNNEFRVGVPVDEAWAVLTDVEAIAPCMPGAQLTEVEGDTYRGQVKIKVGPITAQYKGEASFVEKDDEAHRAVLDASGRDSRGQGNASAMITAELSADGDGTLVKVDTDLKITGKVAQFGRSAITDVSAKLLGQFVDCLEAKLEAGELGAGEAEPAAAASENGAPAADAAAETADAPSPSGAAPSSGARKIDSPEPEPLDLLETAGAPAAKMAAPALLILLIVLLLFRRRKS